MDRLKKILTESQRFFAEAYARGDEVEIIGGKYDGEKATVEFVKAGLISVWLTDSKKTAMVTPEQITKLKT